MMTWKEVGVHIQGCPFHEDYRILRNSIQHPSMEGFARSVGEIKGQLADWRKTLLDGTCLHVIEFPSKYVCHRDKKNPNEDPVGHLWADARHWILAALVEFVIVLLIIIP